MDYLRGIVIILVVYHHTFLGMERSGIDLPKTVGDANMMFYSFRMPLFFIISGIFVSVALASKTIKTIIWNKFNALLYPYIIWSFLQITLQIALSRYTNSDRTYSDYLYILYQPKQIDQFWYLPALFNATIVFLFIKSRFKIKAGYHLLLGVAFFLFAPFVSFNSLLSNWMRFYIFFVLGDILSGYLLDRKFQAQLKRPVFFLAILPVFIAAQYYYFHRIGVRSLENDSASLYSNYTLYCFYEISFLVTCLVGCVTFILLSFQIERWNRLKWLRIVGFHSLYIYIMHVIIVAFVRIFFTRFSGIHNPVIILMTGICFGVVIPIIFYNLVGRKYLWFLYSTKKPDRQNKVAPQAVLPKAEVRLTAS